MNENIKSPSQDVLDSALSPDKGGRSVTIPVAKLWWAAAAGVLTLLVSVYPFFLESRPAVSAFVVRGCACALNIFSLCATLRYLWTPLWIPERMRMPCDFILYLFISFALAVGVGRTYPGNGIFVLIIGCILLLLSATHVLYCLRFSKETCWAMLMHAILVFWGLYLACLPSQQNDIFTCFVCLGVVCILALYNFARWTLAGVPQEFRKKMMSPRMHLMLADATIRTWKERARDACVTLSAFIFASVAIPDVWYASIYTVAEYATYHDMPTVVEACLPTSGSGLTLTQQKHIGTELTWCKKAQRYALQHGDIRSTLAYLRLFDRDDERNRRINELALEVNVLPLLREEKKWYHRVQLDDAALSKQISFDEPELLDYLSGLRSSQRIGALCVEAVVKNKAKKCAVYLIKRDGGRASYGEEGATRTLLQVAIEHNNPEMVELLLKYGADPDYAQDGDTPRRMAEKMKWPYVIKLCRELQYEAQ